MKRQKAQNNNLIEDIIHGVFLIMGLITVGCVLLITVYLVISGIPAIREIGLREFLLGKVWASTAAEPKYGILPFILTSVYGTAGACCSASLSDFSRRCISKVCAARGEKLNAGRRRCAGRYPVSGVRPRGNAGAGAGDKRDLRRAGWSEPARVDNRARGDDSPVHHQGVGHGAGGRAAGI